MGIILVGRAQVTINLYFLVDPYPFRETKYSFVANDPRKMKVDFGFIENNCGGVELLKENLIPHAKTPPMTPMMEESCDFSETSMLENAIISPPKLIESRFSKCESKTENVKEELNDTIVEVILDDTQNEEDTVREYNSILTEENTIKVLNFHMNSDQKYNINANTNAGNVNNKTANKLKPPPLPSPKKIVHDNFNRIISKNLSTISNYTNENTNFTTGNNITNQLTPKETNMSTYNINNNTNSIVIEATSPKKKDNCIIF
jgi:hypothetical protein